MSTLNFEILIDDVFSNINTDASLSPITNKTVLSLINDFEDGKWRFTKFQNFIWDNIIETALSKNEREKLVNQDHSRLIAAAKNLRLTDKENDIGKGSELAEIILYGIMKRHYGALSAVPKIFYKQNVQDNAKGADSVHIVLDDNNDFSIWFGEAKFYNSIEDARLGEIIESVGNSIQTEKLKKENSIITNVSDIDYIIEDKDLRDKIKALLSGNTSIDDFKPKLHIPILLLHECSKTKAATELTDDYKNDIIAYHKNRTQSYFSKQISKIGGIHKYSDITFHLILFPVPDKKEIVGKFITNVEHYKNQ
jgi:DNA-binding HxlR family transcriptional regulator